MNILLTERQRALVKVVCSSKNGTKAQLADGALEGTLSPNEIDTLCELISDEMMMNGIEETFEPNEYGRELEALLDAINAPRLHSHSLG
jgi:hypothetical protein